MRSTITLPFPHTSHFFIILAAPKFEALGHRERKEGFPFYFLSFLIILAAPKFEALGHRERKEGFPFSMSLVFDNFVKFFTEENGLF